MRRALRVVVVAASVVLAVLVVTFGLTRGEQGAVIGSPHDLGTAGVSTCEVCHLPHEASGQRLWSDDPHAGDERLSGVAPLCYSCHDGTVAEGLHVFDVGLAQHPVQPGQPGEDCDMCHDPHVADNGNFLLFPSGANLCRTCHGRAGDGDHEMNTDAAAHGSVPVDDTWNPAAGDFSGARLWDEGGARPGTFLKCLSCHGAHGAASETLLSVAAGPAGSSALCVICHRW